MQRRVTLALAGVSLAGCATVYDGKYDWQDGWRRGRIEAIGSPTEFPGAFGSCMSDPPAERYANVAYVLSMIHIRSMVHRVVPLRDKSMRAGQDVFVNVKSCDQELQRRDDGVPF